MNDLFAIFDTDKNIISGEYSIEDLIDKAKELPNHRKFLSYYGMGSKDKYHVLRDNKNHPVKEGDYLSLEITEDLMATSFNNSNLGIAIKREGDIKSVLLAMNDKDDDYQLYFVRTNGYVNRKEEGFGEIQSVASGDDKLFPAYFLTKGAVIVANAYTDPEYLTLLTAPMRKEKEDEHER